MNSAMTLPFVLGVCHVYQDSILSKPLYPALFSSPNFGIIGNHSMWKAEKFNIGKLAKNVCTFSSLTKPNEQLLKLRSVVKLIGNLTNWVVQCTWYILVCEMLFRGLENEENNKSNCMPQFTLGQKDHII